MYKIAPNVIRVTALADYKLSLVFDDGVEGVFDCKPYLGYEFMSGLRDPECFSKVRPDHGTVMWADGTDLCPDDIYSNCDQVRSVSAGRGD